MDLGLVEATRRALTHLKGAHGIVVMSLNEPDKIVAARIGNAGGVVIGIGEGEMFVASDMPAILDHTRKIVFLETRQMAVVTRDGVEVQTIEGKPVHYEVHPVSWDPVSAEKGEYRHFMHKEIHEQVRSLTDTISGRVDFEEGRVCLAQLNLTHELAQRIRKIYITACGTAAHAGMVGKVLIEHIARIPVEVDIASEFRYRDPIVDEDTVVLAISQSGETADTLAAMEEARHTAGCCCGRSSTPSARRPCASQMATSRCRPARRSAWPRPKLSPRPWWICTCWRSCWLTCAALLTDEQAA
jgi:glutamine---fructose-6-phosphate transaminase (isomerizing)